MKKLKRIIAVVLAISISIGILTMTVSAAEADPEITAHLMSEEETIQLLYRTRMAETGTVYLPRNNATGTNGNPCGAFTADKTNVSFAIKAGVPGATNFNVQLYVGELGNGFKAADYARVPIGLGVTFYDLVVGKDYYFVVSSDTVSGQGATATYTFETF